MFKPFFAELDRRKAVVFVHPTGPQCCAAVLPGIEPSLIEYMFDVTRAIVSLLFAGTFATFPNIRFIFSQGGGATTTLAARITAWGARHNQFAAAIPNGVSYELERLYFDVANSTSPLTLTALRTLASGSRVLFGSDAPYVPMAAATTEFDAAPLPGGVREAIDRDNALRLFPRLDAGRLQTNVQ